MQLYVTIITYDCQSYDCQLRQGGMTGRSDVLASGTVVLVSCALACLGGVTLVLGCCACDERCRLWLQRIYTACLVTVGACTLISVGRQDAAWVLSALAYAGLTVGATWERTPADI